MKSSCRTGAASHSIGTTDSDASVSGSGCRHPVSLAITHFPAPRPISDSCKFCSFCGIVRAGFVTTIPRPNNLCTRRIRCVEITPVRESGYYLQKATNQASRESRSLRIGRRNRRYSGQETEFDTITKAKYEKKLTGFCGMDGLSNWLIYIPTSL